MKLIIGLGNIGSEYAQTRHNAGFLCLDNWAARRNLGFSRDRLFDFLTLKNARAIKPLTYMNRSGLALAEALRRWKITESLVICDDIELPLASVRIRNGGGDGGHNGLKSLFEAQPPEDIKRIRIGIGRGQENPRDYVLDQFQEGEFELLKLSLDLVCGLIDTYINRDFGEMLNQYSKWKKSCSGEKTPGIICP